MKTLRKQFSPPLVSVIYYNTFEFKPKKVLRYYNTFEFKPKKVLRQCDPLTLFLYLIIAEGLASVVRHAHEKNLLESIVNMLQYVDDTLFFCKATTQCFSIKIYFKKF